MANVRERLSFLSSLAWKVSRACGVACGARVWLLGATHRGGWLRGKGMDRPVYVRARTSDLMVFSQVFAERQYEIAEPETISRIIDGGANAGFVTVFFAQHCPASEILAVECDPENFLALQRNVAGLPNVHCVHAAIWGGNEGVEIANPSAEKWAHYVQPATQGDNGAIRGIRLDDILEERGWDTVDIVKLDIEGAELEVFAALGHWLLRVRVLLCELHDRMKPGCSQEMYRSLLATGRKYSQFIRGEVVTIMLEPYDH